MRRMLSPVFIGAAAAACLLACRGASAAPAEVATGPVEQFVTAWMSVVGVIGASDEVEFETEASASLDAEMKEDTFVIDEDGEAARTPQRERRDRDRGEGERRHHRGGHAHGGPHDRGPHGPPGMGPGRMGPDMQHPAMRAFHEIIRRLGRIEEKLGIENGPPSGPMGERARGPRPEMHRHRGQEAGPGRPRPEMPEEMRRQMSQRMEEGKERMEQARRMFQAMEARIKQLEAEVERLKAAK